MAHLIVDAIEFLEKIGIKIVLFVAGFVGGLASVDRQKNNSIWIKIMSLISGGFSANYLTPVVGDWMNLKESTLYGVAFLIGYGGLKFVELTYNRFSKTTQKINKDEKD